MAEYLQDEFTIIAAAQNGDLEAFNALVLTYQDNLFTLAYRILGDSDSAADATQDAFINAYRKLNTFQGGNFKAWLARIVTNGAYDLLRHEKRRPADYINELPGSESDDGAAVPAPTPTPEQITSDNELQRAIQDCINQLGSEQRSVMVLSDVQGLSYQEIADTVDANIGTVKSRLSRARLNVRRCLQNVKELLPAEYRLISDE
jgi:RNA polymerase sigma factor (sigma-70 family)